MIKKLKSPVSPHSLPTHKQRRNRQVSFLIMLYRATLARNIKKHLTMNNDLKTLFHPFLQGSISADSFKKVLFLNARHHPEIKNFTNLGLLQFFKPYADELITAGYKIHTDVNQFTPDHDLILILIPKNLTEAKGLIAHGITFLKKGGVIICAADNKAGGTRLKQILEEYGLMIIDEESKNKARVVWAKYNTANNEQVTSSITLSSEKFLEKIKFHSMSGIFGWDKIDQGSVLLKSCLPEKLEGKGADFGCGYGYLSQFILEKFKNIQKLNCIDADFRALQMCEKNCIDYKEKCEFIWADLARPYTDLKNLDFIIMNPPFHEGKKEDVNIGHMFILNAAKILRKNGQLYMVANRHLPYEDILKKHFTNVVTLDQKNGFKIFKACL